MVQSGWMAASKRPVPVVVNEVTCSKVPSVSPGAGAVMASITLGRLQKTVDLPRARHRSHVACREGLPTPEQVITASVTFPQRLVDHLERRPVGRRVGVAPLAHGREHRPQVPALGGEPVVGAGRVVAVGNLRQDARLDQPGEALVEDVAGDPQALLELVEAGDAEEGVADDQQRPPLADHLEALGHGAVHVGEALAFHDHPG